MPACNGEFIARMGKTTHHFAHSKDACDETISSVTGLYEGIRQILKSGNPFYVPALVVSYYFPNDRLIDEEYIELNKSFIREDYNTTYKEIISPGRYCIFEKVELSRDNKNHIQALELICEGRKMAIKVMPPDTVCKTGAVSPHKDMATLIVDFTKDEDIIQASNSTAFQEYLLSERLDKRWISNPKIKKKYPDIISESQEAHRKYIERQKQRDEEWRISAEQAAKKQRIIAEQIKQQEIEQNLKIEQRKAKVAAYKERQKTSGYEEVKDKFVQQTKQIRDSFGFRWVKCKYCGEIKRESEFASYGGINHVNLGDCALCSREREQKRRNQI